MKKSFLVRKDKLQVFSHVKTIKTSASKYIMSSNLLSNACIKSYDYLTLDSPQRKATDANRYS